MDLNLTARVLQAPRYRAFYFTIEHSDIQLSRSFRPSIEFTSTTTLKACVMHKVIKQDTASRRTYEEVLTEAQSMHIDYLRLHGALASLTNLLFLLLFSYPYYVALHKSYLLYRYFFRNLSASMRQVLSQLSNLTSR